MWIKHILQTRPWTLIGNPNEPEPDDLQFQICFQEGPSFQVWLGKTCQTGGFCKRLQADSWVITCLLQPTHVVNITLGKLLKESNLWCIDTVHSPFPCHWDRTCKPVELLHLSSERCHHPRRDGAPLLEAPNPTDNEISESQQKPALRQRTDTSPWARTMQMTSWMWSTWILFTATSWLSQSLLTRKFSACACKVSNLSTGISVGMLCLAFWSQKQPWMKRNTWKKNFLVWSS